MIFVTLGTQDKKFPRLLQAVEQINTDERIIIQTGSTEYKSNKKKLQVVGEIKPEMKVSRKNKIKGKVIHVKNLHEVQFMKYPEKTIILTAKN